MIRSAKRLAQFALVLASWFVSVAAQSADATFKMRGSEFTVVGNLVAFDGKKYTVETKSFGTILLDSQKFDCVSTGCSAEPIESKPGSTVDVTTPRIVLSGSDSIGDQLMPKIVQAYARSIGGQAIRLIDGDLTTRKYRLAFPGDVEIATVELRKSGTSPAFQELEQKSAQIVMASRAISETEAQHLASLGLGDFRQPESEHVLALDGLLVLVSPGNPARAISIDNLAKVLSGSIRDWSSLNLPTGPINVYVSPAAEGTSDTLNINVLGPRGLGLSPTAQRTKSNFELADLVARDPAGIGVSGLAYQQNARALNIEASCGLQVKPSAFAIKTEEYPLHRLLYLYTAGVLQEPIALGLLNFALSPAAQAIIRKEDFVDQDVNSLSFGDQSNRFSFTPSTKSESFDPGLMRNLLAELRTAKRLTTTFRFRNNTGTLDSKSIGDVSQLVDFLTTPANLGKRALLVGFADSVGGFDVNLSLAEKRAQAVQQMVLRVGAGRITPDRLIVRSYSALAPVACNDTAEQRRLNRRVEVWLTE